MQQQRLLYKKGLLAKERIQILKELGFVWVVDVRAQRQLEWNARLEDLKAYKAEYGDCYVPENFKANPLLGRWVRTKRYQYKKGLLAQERIQKLEKLGFVFDDVRAQRQSEWNACFQELKAYKADYGDCLVPTRFKDNPFLGKWVSTQRVQYKKFQEDKKSSNITEERIQMLEEIGFVFKLKYW